MGFWEARSDNVMPPQLVNEGVRAWVGRNVLFPSQTGYFFPQRGTKQAHAQIYWNSKLNKGNTGKNKTKTNTKVQANG